MATPLYGLHRRLERIESRLGGGAAPDPQQAAELAAAPARLRQRFAALRDRALEDGRAADPARDSPASAAVRRAVGLAAHVGEAGSEPFEAAFWQHINAWCVAWVRRRASES